MDRLGRIPSFPPNCNHHPSSRQTQAVKPDDVLSGAGGVGSGIETGWVSTHIGPCSLFLCRDLISRALWLEMERKRWIKTAANAALPLWLSGKEPDWDP